MSEGRQLAALLAGAAVLVVVGIIGATAFPEPCEEVEGIGSLSLSFTDAADVLPVTPGEAAAVEGLGAALGIGDWRGAVALPPDAQVLPSDFGFFAVTPTDLVALRPGTGLASAPRDVSDLTVIGVGGTSAGLVAEDRTIAVVASDYERERCGQLPDDGEVLAVDRGFALVRTDAGAVTLWSLSGGAQDRDDVASSPVVAGLFTDDHVVLASDDAVTATQQVTGEAAGTVQLESASPLAAVHDHLLLLEADDPSTVVDVTVGEDGRLTTSTVDAPAAVRAAVPTPAGTVLLTEDGLATDRGETTPLPAGLSAQGLLASQDGQVGVLVDGTDGPVLLVWGRDLPAAGDA